MLRKPLLIIACALFVVPSLARATTSYIYVESNVASVPDQNSIYAFANNGVGNLIALPGSPYLTGGTGNSTPGDSDLDADQEVIANQDGSVLYAVNARSNSIAAFRVNADGTLTTISGSPFASGGRIPVSIGLSGKF